MGRIPCCEKENVKRGQWTPEEDNKLSSYIAQHGTLNWRLIPKNAGLQRCGKSCRLRWTNYLRPDLKHGQFSDSEEQTIVKLHAVVGNRWSLIAAQLPGRTDNDVKNHWNTKLKKKLSGMGIDPVTHKPFSHLMAEIATTLAPPQVAHLAEAALGCFKDEMLHLLTKKRIDSFHLRSDSSYINNTINNVNAAATYNINTSTRKDDDHEKNNNMETIEKIKLGLSKELTREPDYHDQVVMLPTKQKQQQQQPNWDVSGTSGAASANNYMVGTGCNTATFHGMSVVNSGGYHDHDQYGVTSCYGNEGDHDGSPWSQGMCTTTTASTCTAGKLVLDGDQESEDIGKHIRNASSTLFNSECVLWDLHSDDIIHPIV